MLQSITEDNSAMLTKTAREYNIKQEQIVQIVSNHNGTVTLYYYEK